MDSNPQPDKQASIPAAPDFNLYAVNYMFIYGHYRQLYSACTLGQTQSQAFKMIHVKVMFIWKAVRGLHSMPWYW